MKTVILTVCLFFITFFAFSKEYQLSICAIFQNEAPYLHEWIKYHRKVGVEHFWLYNNESTDDYMQVLQHYIDDGVVELIDFPDPTPHIFFGFGCQPACYKDAILRSRDKTEWLAIIDLDEYIVPKTGRSIKKILRNQYSQCCAIYVNWLQFGTGGAHVGPGPILHALTKCAKIDNGWNLIGKSIVRPGAVVDITDPHMFKLLAPNIYLNGSGEVFDGKHQEKYLRINHYTFRDEWYLWNVKIPRCKKWNQKIEDVLERNLEFSESEDTFIFNLFG